MFWWVELPPGKQNKTTKRQETKFVSWLHSRITLSGSVLSLGRFFLMSMSLTTFPLVSKSSSRGRAGQWMKECCPLQHCMLGKWGTHSTPAAEPRGAGVAIRTFLSKPRFLIRRMWIRNKIELTSQVDIYHYLTVYSIYLFICLLLISSPSSKVKWYWYMVGTQ